MVVLAEVLGVHIVIDDEAGYTMDGAASLDHGRSSSLRHHCRLRSPVGKMWVGISQNGVVVRFGLQFHKHHRSVDCTY